MAVPFAYRITPAIIRIEQHEIIFLRPNLSTSLPKKILTMAFAPPLSVMVRAYAVRDTSGCALRMGSMYRVTVLSVMPAYTNCMSTSSINTTHAYLLLFTSPLFCIVSISFIHFLSG